MNEAIQKQILIEQRITNESKSTAAAYLLWFFFGLLGGHRFYLGRTGSALTMLLLTVIGWMTAIFLVGIILLLAVAVWVLIDVFLIPGIIRDNNEALRQHLVAEYSCLSSA